MPPRCRSHLSSTSSWSPRTRRGSPRRSSSSTPGTPASLTGPPNTSVGSLDRRCRLSTGTPGRPVAGTIRRRRKERTSPPVEWHWKRRTQRGGWGLPAALRRCQRGRGWVASSRWVWCDVVLLSPPREGETVSNSSKLTVARFAQLVDHLHPSPCTALQRIHPIVLRALASARSTGVASECDRRHWELGRGADGRDHTPRRTISMRTPAGTHRKQSDDQRTHTAH
jgi:hypothetical protein